jgi:hypothetical protein
MDLIYHYTSINVLALILNHKTLRMNCLNNVDDMNEGVTIDCVDMKNFLFVSSWTKASSENIALWNMYTPNMKGIRIGLPEDMLDLKFDGDFITNGTPCGKDVGEAISVYSESLGLPISVTYSSNRNNYPVFGENPENEKKVLFSNIGLVKDTLWEFQNEIRFRYIVYPQQTSSFAEWFKDKQQAIIAPALLQARMDLSCIDLPIKQEALNQMEILLGPLCGESDKILVDSLVKTYLQNKENRVISSELKIRRR